MKRFILISACIILGLAVSSQVKYTLKENVKSSPAKIELKSQFISGDQDLDPFPKHLGKPYNDIRASDDRGRLSSKYQKPIDDIQSADRGRKSTKYQKPVDDIQSAIRSRRSTKYQKPVDDIRSGERIRISNKFQKPVYDLKLAREVSFVEMGEAGNAFGFFGNGRTYLWADNNIGALTFTHRMTDPPGTGYLAYDLSIDKGNTWNNNIQVYDPELSYPGDARYPQGAIYNPVGNTDPANAFYTYFAAILDNSNPSGDLDWGGYGYGVHRLDGSLAPTQHNLTSDENYKRLIPNALTVTQDGVLWMVDSNEEDDNGEYKYLDQLIVGKAVFNEATNDYDYEEFLMDAPINPESVVNDLKIAFSPDGQTGYIMMLSEIEELDFTSYHPIIYKTEDGGENWTDDPIEVELGGLDGIEAIKEWLTDEQLEVFFEPPVPDRDEIRYFAGFHGDLIVDAFGNPHITVMIAVADETNFYYPEECFATWHLYSLDGGETWDATPLKTLKTFSGEFVGGGASIEMYNRPQISSTMDGLRLFFSCLDTDFEGIEDNVNPDIWVGAYDVLSREYTECVNVTEYTQAWMTAWFGSLSHYVFSEIVDNKEVCTVPIVYEELDQSLSPVDPVQFWYINDVVFEFLITGQEDIKQSHIINMYNYPNPVNDETTIKVTLSQSATLDFEVHSLTGQLVHNITSIEGYQGVNRIDFNASGLTTGIYFYTIKTKNESLTGKMIVE